VTESLIWPVFLESVIEAPVTTGLAQFGPAALGGEPQQRSAAQLRSRGRRQPGAPGFVSTTGHARPLARCHAPRRARDRANLSREVVRLRPISLQARGSLRRCNGTAPLPAFSGKTVRHRLSDPRNRADPRQAPARRRAPTSTAASAKERPSVKRNARSSATSPAPSSNASRAST